MTAQEPEWTIEFYVDARGKSEVADFIDGLPVSERAKIRHYLRLLRDFGTRLGEPYAKAVQGHKPLWELRPQPNRILYFAHRGRRFVMLHAFRKKGRKLIPRDIAQAETRMADFLEREG